METADFVVQISVSEDFAKTPAQRLQIATRIANQLVGANAKAAGITKGTNFRPKAGSAGAATAVPGSRPTSVAAAATPTPAPGQPASPATLVVAVGAPSLVGGNVQVPVRTTGSASAPYAGFSVHLRWDKAVFTYLSANSSGSVLASPFCPSPTVDSDGGGVTYACTSTSGSVTTTGLLATIVLAPAAAGCSPLHLFTFGAPDGGDATSGTYAVDAATSEPQAVLYADGSASVSGQTC